MKLCKPAVSEPPPPPPTPEPKAKARAKREPKPKVDKPTTVKPEFNGNVSFTHPQGLHDDIVDGVMMANLARNEQAFTKSKLYIGNPNKNQYERI